jgi:ribosomal protein S6--L-glutamate ligase
LYIAFPEPRPELVRRARGFGIAFRAPLAPLMPSRSKSKTQPRRATRSHKIVILSVNESLYSTHRLVLAARERGHTALVLNTLKCNLILTRGKPQVFYEGRPLSGVNVVIPRIGASITGYGLAVVNQFDMMGTAVLNNSVPIARARDKLRALQLLARFGLDIPRTVLTRDKSFVPEALKRIGGLPAIVKLIQGTQGVGVMIASTPDEIQTILNTFWQLGQEILVQEFIKESKGRDVRAFVVGERVVAAMRRRAKSGEFRSNLHRGGTGKPVDLPPEYEEAAVMAARVIGLEVAGVDMLESKTGPKIMEVNSSPGLEGIERATKKDVAGAVIEHAIRFGDAHESGFSKKRLI